MSIYSGLFTKAKELCFSAVSLTVSTMLKHYQIMRIAISTPYTDKDSSHVDMLYHSRTEAIKPLPETSLPTAVMYQHAGNSAPCVSGLVMCVPTPAEI